jgi:hypothetical protein
MITFAIGAFVGAGCVVVWSEMYTRWLYKDVKRRAKAQGISEEKMRAAIIKVTQEKIEAGLGK